nr:DUF4350 domain-containing protein [Auraticoccus cholistanensis]
MGRGERRSGDPRSTRPDGTAVLVAVLAGQGVDVRVAGSVASAARGARSPWTLVVSHPDDLRADEWQRLLAAGPSELVLLSPGADSVARLDLPVRVTPLLAPQVADPGCDDPAAARAGSTRSAAADLAYAAADRTAGCYGYGRSGWGSLRLPVGATGVHLLGTGWANAELLDEGNASYALQSLGRHAELVWLPAPEPRPEPEAEPAASPSLLPPWWQLAVLQLLAAFVALLLWRGRRLGPVVTEGLPVVVPAGEAVEGHGRLYHRIGAREHAAEVLRRATRARLTRRLGPSDPLALVEVVSTTTGADRDRVRRVLAGPPPADDDELARLARELRELEEATRAP